MSQEKEKPIEGNNNEPTGDEPIEIIQESSTVTDLIFKIIVIGDSGVGKSSLTKRAVKNSFEDDQMSTIGFEFFTINCKMNNLEIR